MTETVSGFFSGGGHTAKFPTIGSKVEGVITAVHPPEPQTDFETRQPIPGKSQMRIDLKVDFLDPDITDDDLSRTLYVKGWMTGAIGDALKKVGAKEPLPGARLAVTYVADGPPTRPGLQGPKQYAATYTPSAGYFNGGPPPQQVQQVPPQYQQPGGPPQQQAPPQQAPPQQVPPQAPVQDAQQAPVTDQPPPGISPEAWKTMPADAKQAIANVAAGLAPPY